MNRQITVWGSRMALLGLILIAIFAMKEQLNNQLKTNWNNQIVAKDVYEIIKTDTVDIAVEDLPYSIRTVIKNDSLINELKITSVKKISKRNNNYYDVCFQDSEDFSILIMYNRDGGVINQFHAYE